MLYPKKADIFRTDKPKFKIIEPYLNGDESLTSISKKKTLPSDDVMGCQRDIAKKIRECEADYVLALKGNQSELQEMVSDFFTTAIEKNFAAIEHS